MSTSIASLTSTVSSLRITLTFQATPTDIIGRNIGILVDLE